MGKHGVFDATRVQLPYWQYISGYSETNPNSHDVALPQPSEGLSVVISSEDGKSYYTINGAFAQADSPGYIPTDGERTVGPIGNLTSIHITGAAATVHIQIFREV
jgi:flagellar basal body rod protein FlgG